MYNVEFQRELLRPGALERLESVYGVVPMHRGRPVTGDAQPILTTSPSSGVPAWLANWIDPDVLRILYAPLKAEKILGDSRKVGDWTTATAQFPVVELTGNVSSYGDFSNAGSSGANANFPTRQSYHFQTVSQVGEREQEIMALAKLNWLAEKREGATRAMNTFANGTYFYGVSGLQNYGLLNDPALPSPITPATKAWGGTQWVSGGVVKATANEIFADIQSLYIQLVSQSGSTVELETLDQESPLVLAMSPGVQFALTTTNEFKVNVFDLLQKNFPNMRFETAPQYATASGQLVQLIAETVEGQRSAHTAFTEKLRAHRVVFGLSGQAQKVSAGTWGAIIRQPFAIAGLLGV